MTRASHPMPDRHDTLDGVTRRSGRGTARQTVRVPEPLWERFGELATREGTDRSKVLMAFIEKYVAERDGATPGDTADA